MATLKEIIQYSKENPNTDYAKGALQNIKSGKWDSKAQEEGIDLSPFGRPGFEKPAPEEPTFSEKLGTGITERIRDVPSDFQDIGENIQEGFSKRTDRISQNIERRSEGGFSPLEIASTGLDIGGATLATLTDSIFQGALGLAKSALTQEQEDAITKKISQVGEKVVNTDAVKRIVAGWNDFEEQNPEAASNLKAAGDFTGALADMVGLKVGSMAAKKTVQEATKQAAEVIQKTAPVIKRTGQETAQVLEKGVESVDSALEARRSNRLAQAAEQDRTKIQEMVAPGLNTKEARVAMEQGRLTRGKESFFFGKKPDVVEVTDKVKSISETIQRLIPNSARMDDAGLLKNIRETVGSISDSLLPKMEEVKLRDIKPTETPIVKVANRFNNEEEFISAFSRGELDVDTVKQIQAIYGDDVIDNPALLRDLYKRSQNPSMIDVAFDAWEALKKRQSQSPEFVEFSGSKRFQDIFENHLNQIRKGNKEKTLADLWEIRKQYDASIPVRIKQATDNSPITSQIQKEMWLENRRILNDIINDASRGLGDESGKAFRDMSDLYTARENIVGKTKVDTKGSPGVVGRTTKFFTKEALPFGLGAFIF